VSMPTSGDVERFRGLVGARLGLNFDESRLGQLADVLATRLAVASISCEAYLARLGAAPFPRDELRALARDLTVGETYFFRNPDQFRAFSEVALPDLLSRPSGPRRLRILSAGCASGEEAYSIAILLADRIAAPWTASIRAVDLNSAALAKAAEGRYSAWALRDTSEEIQRRWFHRQGRDLVLGDEPRRRVVFEERNLVEPDPALWGPEAYDVVFCRNVLMYLTPQNAAKVMECIERSTAQGGYLFIGHAETLRGLSQGFHLRHTHGTFYYQRRHANEPPSAMGSTAEVTVDPAPFLSVVDGAATWVEAIRRASDRIHALAQSTSRGGHGAVSTQSTGRPRQPWELGSALELLRAEKFGDALDLVRGLPEEAASDPEVLLLRATLLTHDGQIAEAEEACEELLGVDELNAGAHYLLALCREGQGDAALAKHHDQLAAYLDPSFAMPRLHMGLLARRAGDRLGASRELTDALDLIRREDASRLLLFGGGFNRDALAALCEAELASCGATV
jgi:chemotaxis protein methyltransferase CheR